MMSATSWASYFSVDVTGPEKLGDFSKDTQIVRGMVSNLDIGLSTLMPFPSIHLSSNDVSTDSKPCGWSRLIYTQIGIKSVLR